MSITVQRHLRTVLESRVREQVRDDAAVDGEIRELMEILSRGGAGE